MHVKVYVPDGSLQAVLTVEYQSEYLEPAHTFFLPFVMLQAIFSGNMNVFTNTGTSVVVVVVLVEVVVVVVAYRYLNLWLPPLWQG